jgi:acetate kinase
MSRIAVVNTGASTLKLVLVEVDDIHLREIERAHYDWQPDTNRADVLRSALERFDHQPDAFGHRFVHGGTELVEPVTLDREIEARLEQLVSLAPLHNASALEGIRAVRAIFPSLPAVAIFDTAFHTNRPEVSMRYALPKDLVDDFGLRRFGFHGLAHMSLLDSLAKTNGAVIDDISCVTLQLGAGCSACAIQYGRSVETSMGFTPLEGLVMATRSGDIDPAIVLRLTRAGYNADQIEDALTRKAGLFALTGFTDMRDVLAAQADGRDDAHFAIELFCHRIIQTVGAYFTLLGGEGALVFGGGIGTNAPQIRERIAAGLAAWCIELDPSRNRLNEPGPIQTEQSRPVYVFETNEEKIVARLVDSHLNLR